MVPRAYWFLVFIAICACSSKHYLTIQLRAAEKDFKDHIGFVLYDPVRQQTIFTHQGERYFAPASNTKIFTFFAALKLLGDSVPALRYNLRNDSLVFWGTGAPGFLYENTCSENRVYSFLKNNPFKLFFSSSNFQTECFGPGWAWDDYSESFQVERTSFPIYGNRATIKKTGNIFISTPAIFSNPICDSSIIRETPTLTRGVLSNTITYTQAKTNRPAQWKIPFHYSDELLIKLLTDTLKKEVKLLPNKLTAETKILYSTPIDSLYKVMMQESDNFIAEQLLLVCANVISDTLRPEIAIDYVKKKFLFDLPDTPVWVDGSGLSRYNLFTPRSIVRLWEKIYAIVPRNRLFGLLAVGGESGTLKNNYKSEKPFIIGKTGTFSNNHTLSGFLVTKRGRTLIFSWMNNNFTANTAEVRGRMETVLRKIYEKY